MGKETEFRRVRGFGDTNFSLLGQVDDGAPATPLPEAVFSFDLQGESERNWRVQHFEVTEALSTLYECVLDLASETFTENPDLMLGRYALLQVSRDPVLRRFYGVVRRVEQRGATGTSRLARVFVVPALWALSQRSNARVFQDATAVEVVQAVLQGAGLYLGMLQLMLLREYPKREYCVQYRETDLAFVMRLLESEGITFFFRHDHDGTEALVLTDGQHAWPPVPTMDGGAIPVAGPEAGTHRVEVVRNLTWEREQRPTRVTVRDFDFTRPTFTIEGFAPRRADDSRGLYEPAPALTVNQYEGATYTRDDAQEQAQLRFEAELGPGALGAGDGRVTGMMPGQWFALMLAGGHVPEQRYVVTRVEHVGDAQEELVLATEREALGEDRYHNRFHCALQEAPLRPARRTPRPVIAGIETATVTGPAGEEIYTDEHGRIRVQFHWDRLGARDERSSCWLRAVQGPWAGGGWGFQFLPRVGMEVAVTFIEGDPDRPVIVGALYNGRNIPGFELPAQRTRSGVRTQTVGGAGFNELSFEDSAGAEQVRVHAQRDLEEVVRNDRTARVGRDKTTAVDGSLTLTVGRDARVQARDSVEVTSDRVEVAAGVDQRVTVGRDQHESVGRSRYQTVHASLRQEVEGNRASHVGGYDTLFVGEDRDVTVQGSALEAVWGDRSLEVKGDHTVRVEGDHERVVEGDVSLRARGEVTVRARTLLTLTCGACAIEMTPDEIVLRGPSIRVETGQELSLSTKRASLEFTDGRATLFAADHVDVSAKAVRAAGKDASVELGDGAVRAAAAKRLELRGKGSTVTLDDDATVKGTKVKLANAAAGGEFKSRIGALGLTGDVYVLATQMLSPGGVPLAHEHVRIIDPNTDEAFGAPVETDDRGELRVEVPHPGPWDLALVHGDYEEPDQPHDHEGAWELHVLFVTHRGEPIPELGVTVRGEVTAEVATDDGGVISMQVPPGPYELEVAATDEYAAQVFQAHASRQAVRTLGTGQSYVFVVEPDDPDLPDDIREHRSSTQHLETEEEEEEAV